MRARIDIRLDETLLAAAIAELELKEPPAFQLNHSGRHPDLHTIHGQVRGVYEPTTNLVGITSQGEAYAREGLYVLTKHLRFTVLHELRHAWQRENWSAEENQRANAGEYRSRPAESDANAWAEYAMPLYKGLVVVTRNRIGQSGFSRLSERART